MGRWQRDLSARPDFANRPRFGANRRILGESRAVSPMIHSLWMMFFPCGWSSESGDSAKLDESPPLGDPRLRARRCRRLFHRLFHRGAMSLILASNSQIRRMMLEQAGLEFDVRAPDFDEAEVKQGHRRRRLKNWPAPGGRARQRRSLAGPGDWVIGSDSMVSVDGIRYSKPRDRDEAAAHLRAFSGRAMLLSSAVALARQGRVDWSPCRNRAADGRRPLSETFIATISTRNGPKSAIASGCSGWKAAASPCSNGSREAISPSWECRCCRCSAPLRDAGLDAVMSVEALCRSHRRSDRSQPVAGNSWLLARSIGNRGELRPPPGHARRTSGLSGRKAGRRQIGAAPTSPCR